MNNELLRRGLFGVLIFSVIAVISFYAFRFIKYEKQAEKNIYNCERIERNMSKDQVIEIMGMPKQEKEKTTRINYKDRKVVLLYYDAPNGASVGVEIFLDAETMKVIKTICKE
jgi:hypothetical protein